MFQLQMPRIPNWIIFKTDMNSLIQTYKHSKDATSMLIFQISTIAVQRLISMLLKIVKFGRVKIIVKLSQPLKMHSFKVPRSQPLSKAAEFWLG